MMINILESKLRSKNVVGEILEEIMEVVKELIIAVDVNNDGMQVHF